MADIKTNKKKQSLKSRTNTNQTPRDLLSVTDRFFEKQAKKIFWIGFGLTCIFGALLFDLKISEGSDDSGYIMAAHDFIKGRAFPAWHGSFYPIFLCLPILVFGLNLFVLKFLSFLLMAGHFVVLFHTFKNRVRPTVFALVILMVAVNTDILYFTSSTFSEALYFFLQALAVFYFFKIIDHLKTKPVVGLTYWKLWLVFGLLSFLLSITRNVGLGFVIAFVIYFLLNREFKAILFGIGSFLVFQIPYSIYRNVFWRLSEVGFGGQFKVMFQKNAYNAALGNEDLLGFVNRFLGNSDLYLSKHLFKVIGLRAMDSASTSSILTLVIYLLFFIGLIVAFRKKNTHMQFIGLYIAIAAGSTFIAQQVAWDQVRLIIVFIPVFLIFISYGLYEISEYRYFRIIRTFLLAFLILSFFLTINRTLDSARLNWEALKGQITGQKYSGYTPDLVHFFQVSEWAATNLPEDAVIGSRKPSMSFIYSKGRDFFGIYKVPVLEKDPLISGFINRNADVIIVDNFEMEYKKFPLVLLDAMRIYNKGLILSDYAAYTIFEPSPGMKSKMLSDLAANNISIHTNLAEFEEVMNKSGKKYYAVDPDQLVRYLRENKVKYLIMANIRLFSDKKDGRIMNALQRHVLYISTKYPNMFRPVYKAGNDDDEPAEILEIMY